MKLYTGGYSYSHLEERELQAYIETVNVSMILEGHPLATLEEAKFYFDCGDIPETAARLIPMGRQKPLAF